MRTATRRQAWATVAFILLLGAVTPSIAQTEPTADDIAVIRARALELVNQSREENGLPPLVLEAMLNASAQAHADDMYARHYYDHASPEGKTAADRYVTAGGSKWRLISENIANCRGCRPPARVGILRRLHAGWMQSPEHRENILRPGLTHFGFGMIVDEQKQLYAVQTFAGPGLPRGLEADEELAPLSAAEQTQQALDRFNRVREAAGGARLELSPALIEAAQTILPDRGLETFDLASSKDLIEALPSSDRARWRSISVLEADCGGCGAVPTSADVRFFAQQWLDDPSYKRMLLDTRFTHIGFAIATNGEGMKVALLLLARGR
jgi:uncharacterized protein YkwD